MNELFTIEQYEYLRVVIGEKMATLKSRANGFENDDRLTEKRREELLDANRQDYALCAIIEAKAMREISKSIGNTVLAEVVSLSTAQKLKRGGWEIGKTDFRYSKRSNCTIYDLVPKSKYVVMGADAPNDKELREMCYSVGLIGIEEMPIERLANRLLEYCKRHKLKLSDYDFC